MLFIQELDMLLPPRLRRELKTITAMVKIYCRNHHDRPKGAVCGSCTEFLEYAEHRLSRCPYKEKKPTCGKCTIHCYNKVMQAKARQVMRYSGPRMLWSHPILAFFHLLDGRRKTAEFRSCHRTVKNNQIK